MARKRRRNGWGDPTENAIALNEAGNKRQDDLREAANKLQESENRRVLEAVAHAEYVSELRSSHSKEISDIRDRNIIGMRKAESDRIDAIRQVDVNANKTEAERAQQAIQVQAATNKTDSENLRNALVTTAETVATRTAETFKGVIDRLAALEKSSYEGVGRQRLADPALAELVTEVKNLSKAGELGIGKSKGISMTLAAILSAATFISVVGFICTSAIAITVFFSSMKAKPVVEVVPAVQAVQPGAPPSPRP